MRSTAGWRQGRTTALLLSALLAVAGGRAIAAPQEDSGSRPRVGLVLAGGGAKGIAHVGVIRWLEEHRIPVDLVAGTSMGGLVGGIMATGADAAEMTRLLDSIDWVRVLEGDTPYDEKGFRRREDARFAPGMLEFGLKGGLRLPPGADGGHQVGLVLDRIALPYAGVTSFDELPIPFACVAIDLVVGDEVVFRDGSLALAMRSTMSFPAWFAPVEDGDRVLADGGALNNLPTDVMQRMGPDVIIAVDLSAEASVQESFDTALSAANRSVSIMMRKRTDESDELADILITPDVSEFGLMDFARREEMDRIGYEAAAERAEELLAYAVDEATWQRHRERVAARRRPAEFVPSTLEVTGGVGADDERVAEMLGHHVDVPFDPDLLDYDLTRVTGAGRYAVAGYARVDGPDGPGLHIRLVPKSYGPPFLRPIFTVQGRKFGEATLEIGFRLTVWDVLGTGSEWRTDLLYGRLTGLRTELFVPLGVGGLFVAPRALIGETQREYYEKGIAVADYSDRVAGGGADVGYLFGLRSQLRLGADFEQRRVVITTGGPGLRDLEGPVGVARALWEYEGTNSAMIPTSGVRMNLKGRWVFETPGEDEAFYQAEGGVFAATPVSARFALFGGIAGGTTFGRQAPFLHEYLLGGPFQLGALTTDELRGSKFFIGRAGALWSLSDPDTFSLLGRFYLLAMYELGDAFEEQADPFHNVTVGLAGETVLGAVFLGGAVGEGGRSGFFLTLGRFF